MRYEIRHPCVNDGNMTLWRELGISSWPTLAVVSPTGKLIASLPGHFLCHRQKPTLPSKEACFHYRPGKGLIADCSSLIDCCIPSTEPYVTL